MGHYSFEHVFFFFYARWAGKCKRNAGKFCHTGRYYRETVILQL